MHVLAPHPAGSYAINPATGKPIPIWVADYVLGNYGSGAIMAVPGHDARDFAFAKKFGLDVLRVVAPASSSGRDASSSNGASSSSSNGSSEGELPYTEEGVAVGSAGSALQIDGLPTAEAKAKVGFLCGWHDWFALPASGMQLFQATISL